LIAERSTAVNLTFEEIEAKMVDLDLKLSENTKADATKGTVI
jgi:hypothetical protein